MNVEAVRQTKTIPERTVPVVTETTLSGERSPYPVIDDWLPKGDVERRDYSRYEFAPAFIRNFGGCFFEMERCLWLTEERKERLEIKTPERIDFFAQLENKLDSMASSLKFHFPWEAKALESFFETMVRFWPGFGYQAEGGFKTFFTERGGEFVQESERVASDAERFVEQVPLLLRAGVTAEVIRNWFTAAEGLVFQDPGFCQRLLLPEKIGVSVLPLEGLSPDGEPADAVPADTEGGRKTVFLRKGSAVARMQHFAAGVREESLELLERDGYLRDTLGIEAGRQDLTAEEREALILMRSQILEIAQAAGRTGQVLDIMQGYAREATTLIRPTPFWHLIAPLAGALAEYVEKECGFETGQEDRAYMGERMVRIARRRRLALGKPAIFGLMSAFRFKNQLDFRGVVGVSGKARASMGRWAGSGLELAKRFVSWPEDWKEEKVAKAISETMGEFVLQLRREGLHTFEWREGDYQALGIGDLWEEHGEKLARFSRGVPGVEFVRGGDAVGEMTGQHEPSQVGHDESIREVPQIPFWVLAASMPDLEAFSGRRVVAGRAVNRGNPAKNKLEVAAGMRRRMGRRGLVGAPGVFLYGRKLDIFAHTAARLVHHKQMFKGDRNQDVVIFRITGTDALNQEKLRYTEKEEPGTVLVGNEKRPGWQILNQSAHVFFLQAEDMRNTLGLPERIRRILVNFSQGGAIVCLSTGFMEVHSSFIREKIHKLNDQALATLVHPGNMEDTRELCLRRDRKRADRK